MKAPNLRLLFNPLENESGNLKGMARSAAMTARVSFAFAVISITLLVVSIASFGVSNATPLTSGMILLFTFIFALNARRKVFISSYLLCFAPSIAVLLISMYLKTKAPGDDLHYFDSRIILIAFCALPGLVFSQRDPFMLYSTIFLNFLCLALYDPIHNLFGIGYFQAGFLNSSYYHINTISILVAASIVAGILILKRIVLKEEDKNARLSHEKELRNLELKSQNDQMCRQAEQLAHANKLIEAQKNQLMLYTTQLEEMVKEKSNHLSQSNEELRKYNSELLQFSYTVSHNVRGPVARLLGLTNLIDLQEDEIPEESKKLVSFIKESASELDTVITELSRIIDIRNDLYTVKEKVYFDEEWEHVMKNVAGLIESDMKFETDFSNAPFMYTIRPFLHSILYNLVSNAIRYRSPQRPLLVSVKTTLQTGVININISDNGLGINLDQFGNNIFGMYKRFHTHVQGRGLGLFLVKTQVEALHGSISVESKLNHGTTFKISINVPKDIEGQVCFDCEYGTVLYNARIDTMGLTWKRSVNSLEFKALLVKCVEMLHVYGTPRWVADLRKLDSLQEQDLTWFFDSIMNESSKVGLKTIAIICEQKNEKSLAEYVRDLARRFGVTIHFFNTRSEAESWIEQL